MRSKTKAKRSPYGAVSGDFERHQEKAKRKRGTQGVAAGRVKKEAPHTSGTATKNGGGHKKQASSGGNVAAGEGDREPSWEGLRRSPRNHLQSPPAAQKTRKKACTQGVAQGRDKRKGQPASSAAKKIGGGRKKKQVPASGSAVPSESDREQSRLRPHRSPRKHLTASGPKKNGAGPKKIPVPGTGTAKKKNGGSKKKMSAASSGDSGTRDGGGVRKKPAAGSGGDKKKSGGRKKVGAAGSGKATTGESATKSRRGRSTRKRLPPSAGAQMVDRGSDAQATDSEPEAQVPDWGPCVACNSHDRFNRPMDKDLYRMIRRWRVNHGLCYYTAVGDRAELPAGEALKGQYICTACTRVIGRLVAQVRDS